MTNDLMLVHTGGLDEAIRCAMCTNTMKSDRGCDGGCVIDTQMYEKVLEVIADNLIISSGATNGDIIKAVFPDIKCWVLTDHKEIIALNYKEVVDWWNAPYREGGYK